MSESDSGRRRLGVVQEVLGGVQKDAPCDFYETFKTSYSYTRIGKVKDTASLKKALGSWDVTIKFE